MDKVLALLTTIHGINQEERLLKSRKEAAKRELDALYELGDVDKTINNSQVGLTASRIKTTTYQLSQEAREDIEKIKMMDIELGHATKRETFSWTVRKSKERADG